MLRIFSALGALVVVLTACGGSDDEADAQQTVRDFVEATNRRDGERLCGDLVTQKFKEQANGRHRRPRGSDLRAPARADQGPRARPDRRGQDGGTGERATVRTRLDIDGVQAPRVFELMKEDGAWKLSSGSGD